MIPLLLLAALAQEPVDEPEDQGLSAEEPADEAAAEPAVVLPPHRSGSLPPELAAAALSLSVHPAHAAEVRQSLRYAGEPSYATRRHFMELQWIPDNVAAGWVVDTTADYGRPVQHFEREVTAGTWKAWGRRSLFALTDEQLPVGTMALDVLSLEDALAVVDQIRPGTIVLTVRQDRPWVPIWVTHLGFVLADADQPTVRHATRMSSKVVRDHPLRWYVEHVGTYSNWPTAGIALLEPVEQGPRLSALEE